MIISLSIKKDSTDNYNRKSDLAHGLTNVVGLQVLQRWSRDPQLDIV